MRGGAAVARRVHTPKVAGSTPASATIPPEPRTWAQAFYIKGRFHFGAEGGIIPGAADRTTRRRSVEAKVRMDPWDPASYRYVNAHLRARRIPILMNLGKHAHDPEVSLLLSDIAWQRGGRHVKSARARRFSSYYAAMIALKKASR